jgi:hypothetical protein
MSYFKESFGHTITIKPEIMKPTTVPPTKPMKKLAMGVSLLKGETINALIA